jgi:hypothetical protein
MILQADFPEAIGPAFLAIFGILCVAILIPYIFFLITLQNTLKAISPENRKMPPANVWLMFIPIFNLVWQFIVVNNISESIKAECEILQLPTKENKPTSGIGIAWCICSLCFFIPFASIAALVLWVIYWIKVNEYKNLITENKDNILLDAEKNIFYGGEKL